MDLSEVRKLEEKQQLHELAQAIRRGCKIRKHQCYGTMYQAGMYSCAIGAAIEGLGLIDEPEDINAAFPLLESRVVSFPPYINFCDDTLRRVIIVLNDHCRWSRERIADWIETL